MRTLMLALIAATSAAPLLATSATASDTTDVMAAVNQSKDAFNKGDSKAFLATCAPQAVVVDEFAPYVWSGATACSDWWSANAANDKKLGSTNGVLTISKPWHVTVDGDRAYVVVPAKYTDMQNGKKTVDSAVWTVTLQKTSGWLVTGSAWAQH